MTRRRSEVLIRYTAAGLCHSDMHLMTGDLPVQLPVYRRPRGRRDHRGGRPGRHQGREGRPRRLRVHPVLRPLPLVLDRPPEPVRPRRHDPGRLPPRRQLPVLGGRRRRGRDVHARDLLAVRDDLRGVGRQGRRRPAARGRGAVSAAACRPAGARRSTPATSRSATQSSIYGVGGIGANAVQGAAHAGATRIIAVDPQPFKREFAQEIGATHTGRDGRGGAGARRRRTRPAAPTWRS